MDNPPNPHEASYPNPNQAPLPGYLLEAALEAWNQTGGQHVMPITGRSMLPLFREGDQVLVEHGGAGVRRGDIVVFRHGERLITHRVLRRRRQAGEVFYVTKGDNVLHLDPPVRAGEIVGRVLAIKRGGADISLDTAAWRAFGWLVAIGSLAGLELYGWARGLKRRVWGPQPARLAGPLRRRGQALFSLALRAGQAVAGRWKR